MQKLLKKTAIFLIPFLIVFLLFFLLEPFDYFGLKHNATYLSKPLSAMREVRNEQPANIILGDSRMANLNVAYIEELTGEDWTMLGFGGASLGECIELFWYATEHTALERCVFGVNFYSSGGEQGVGRIPLVQGQADNLFTFVSNFNNWLEVVNAAKYRTKNLLAGLLDKPAWLEYPEDPTTFDLVPVSDEMGETYHKYLEDYAAVLRNQLGDSWFVAPETLQKLYEVADYCDGHGIALTFVFPPMIDSVFELVLSPMGIEADVEALKQALLDRAPVFDLQFRNAFSADDANFHDGFHLAGPQKKLLAELIFTDVESEYIVRYHRGETLR